MGRKPHGPAMDLCIFDDQAVVWNCVNKAGEPYKLDPSQMGGKIATPAEDFENLLLYCKAKKEPKLIIE